jgi:hypothetical protein
MSRYYTDDDDSDRVLKDGEVLRTSMFMLDAAQQEVRDHFMHDHFVRDALARHNATGLHRPGYVLDSLVHAAQPTVSVADASNDLVERRGMELRDAFAARERALNEVEQRQQWRTTLDARMKVEPEDDNEDDDESNGEQIGSAEYGRGGDHENDDNDGDDDSLEALQARREAAYQESVARSSNAWRTAGPANANQRQLERWRGK